MRGGKGRGYGIGGRRQGSGLFGVSRSGRLTIGGIIGAIAAELIGSWIDKKIAKSREKKIEEKEKLENDKTF